ncbi:Dextranase precursor [Pirellulimonas nuda]|uniref:Dextranase n=1 Tax=Pirellulimonas nuda TaxID=2528009 RepID=A0A518DEF0_9BACT|nr:hypothetical protein [Pirellulimonas nuda]QDU89858.1 Dextranase precursor [Pirellulimonas nuda]
MKLYVACLHLTLLTTASAGPALTTHDWPTAPGQGVLSPHYRVWARVGDGPEQEVQVLKSDAIYEGGQYVDGEASDLKGRTFSFASLGYDPAGGPLRVRVERLSNEPVEGVRLAPRSYGLTPEAADDRQSVGFTLDRPQRYVAVDFEAADNRTTRHGWIKHMLCVLVDPPERDAPKPDDAGVVVFSADADAVALAAARVIYFPPGYYNLAKTAQPQVIQGQGGLVLREGQSAYLARGAFVEGHIAGRGDNQRVYGRGVLSGRQYSWDKSVRRSFVHLGHNAVVQGVTIIEAPLHGVVCGDDSLIEDVKIIGWHWNNDGFRPGWRTVVRNCFMRCADDFFYNFALKVSDCVLWPGHNGSIMTYGWRDYTTGGSVMEDIDIINPEWLTLQNNNGLVMSQTLYSFRPTGETTVFRSIRIEGSIPALFNIKANRREPGEYPPALAPGQAKRLGYIGDILLEDVTVDHQFGRGVIQGGPGAVEGTEAVWPAKNIVVRNVRIGGVCLDDSTKDRFIQIDPATTENLVFDGCKPTQP